MQGVQAAAATRVKGCVYILYLPLHDLDNTGFGPPSQASKFQVTELSLLSLQNPVHELLSHLVCFWPARIIRLVFCRGAWEFEWPWERCPSGRCWYRRRKHLASRRCWAILKFPPVGWPMCDGGYSPSNIVGLTEPRWKKVRDCMIWSGWKDAEPKSRFLKKKHARKHSSTSTFTKYRIY